MLFAQISLVYLAFAIDHPQKSGTSADMLCCSQTPRRSDTSADMLCCSQTPQRGDTLVTAGRRPADTATLPTDSVPGGVAHHSSVSQHPLVRLDAKLPQQSLVFIFKAHCLMMNLLVGDIVLHHLHVSLTVG